MKKSIFTGLGLGVLLSAVAYFYVEHSQTSLTDFTMICDGLPPMKVKFLKHEISGSFKVRLFSDDESLSQIIYAPSSKCALIGNPSK